MVVVGEKVAQTLNPFDSADQIAAAYNRTGIGGIGAAPTSLSSMHESI